MRIISTIVLIIVLGVVRLILQESGIGGLISNILMYGIFFFIFFVIWRKRKPSH